MKAGKFSSPLMLALLTGAAVSLSQVATAQTVANGRTEALVIHPRIMLSPGEQSRLQAYADQGIDSLRRYLWRTRMIYPYYYLPDLIDVS